MTPRQDTAANPVGNCPAGPGAGMTCHALPFHASASDAESLIAPTATQRAADAHDTSDTTLSAACDAGWRRHDEPFQDSVSATSLPDAVTKLPAAMHRAARVHETADSRSARSTRSGRHAEPSHDIARLPMSSAWPTAMQLIAAGHETAVSDHVNIARGGMRSAFHLLPFHNIAELPPTAMQFVAAVQETVWDRSGDAGMTVHAVPFHDSTSGWKPLEPTATQLMELLQDTLVRPADVPVGGMASMVQVRPFHFSAKVPPAAPDDAGSE